MTSKSNITCKLTGTLYGGQHNHLLRWSFRDYWYLSDGLLMRRGAVSVDPVGMATAYELRCDRSMFFTTFDIDRSFYSELFLSVAHFGDVSQVRRRRRMAARWEGGVNWRMEYVISTRLFPRAARDQRWTSDITTSHKRIDAVNEWDLDGVCSVRSGTTNPVVALWLWHPRRAVTFWHWMTTWWAVICTKIECPI